MPFHLWYYQENEHESTRTRAVCFSVGEGTSDMNHDLTLGKPGTVLWQFCLPLFGSIIFQQLYNLADSLVAGRFIGENALAAVGNSYEITLVFIAFAFGCNIGCSVITSRLFGAKEYADLKTAVTTSMLATGGVCLVLMAVGLLGGRWLLGLINTPAELMADSALYLDIYVLGLPFLFFYNLSTGIFSAFGDSKTPFWFLAVSSTANIAVDILFVTALHMGVAGVAWATFLCQGVSCVLALWVVMRRLHGIETPCRPALFSRRLLIKFAVIAIPSTLQQCFVSVGNIVIQGVINSFGASVMAGYAAAVKLNNLVVTSLTTLGNGVSNYTAQNLGAGKPERVRQGFGAGLRMTWFLIVPLALCYFFGGRVLLQLFLADAQGAAMASGVQFLSIVSPFYAMLCIKLVADGILRGSGLMGRFMVDTFTDLILRVGLSILFSGLWGSVGIWLSWPVGWFVGTVLSVIFYRTAPLEKK